MICGSSSTGVCCGLCQSGGDEVARAETAIWFSGKRQKRGHRALIPWLVAINGTDGMELAFWLSPKSIRMMRDNPA